VKSLPTSIELKETHWPTEPWVSSTRVKITSGDLEGKQVDQISGFDNLSLRKRETHQTVTPDTCPRLSSKQCRDLHL